MGERKWQEMAPKSSKHSCVYNVDANKNGWRITASHCTKIKTKCPRFQSCQLALVTSLRTTVTVASEKRRSHIQFPRIHPVAQLWADLSFPGFWKNKAFFVQPGYDQMLLMNLFTFGTLWAFHNFYSFSVPLVQLVRAFCWNQSQNKHKFIKKMDDDVSPWAGFNWVHVIKDLKMEHVLFFVAFSSIHYF